MVFVAPVPQLVPFDVGPPLGEIEADASHALVGQMARIHNSVWHADGWTDGWTRCEIAGPATDGALWVVVDSLHNHAYALEPSVLRLYLTKPQKAQFSGRGVPTPRRTR